MCVVFEFEVHWIVGSCSEQSFFCLGTVARCFVNVAFPRVYVLSDVDSAAFYECPVCQYCATEN